MRFTLRTLLVVVVFLAALMWLARYVWSKPSNVTRHLFAIALVQGGVGAVLAAVPPARPRRRPGWVTWIPRGALWGGALAVVVLRSHVDYLVFIAVQAVVYSIRAESATSRVPVVDRMEHAAGAAVLTVVVCVAAACAIQSLTRRLTASPVRPRVVGWWLTACAALAAMVVAGAYDIVVSAPLLSAPYAEAFALALSRLDVAILVTGFALMSAGIASQIARASVSGEPELQRPVPGLNARGTWFHLGWLTRLLIALALLPFAVNYVVNHWTWALPSPGKLELQVPEETSQWAVLAEPTNVLLWLLLAAAMCVFHSAAAAAWQHWVRGEALVRPKPRVAWPVFGIWWAFIFLGCLVALPAIGLLIFPAWHFYLLNS